jgi:hypothetical protein
VKFDVKASCLVKNRRRDTSEKLKLLMLCYLLRLKATKADTFTVSELSQKSAANVALLAQRLLLLTLALKALKSLFLNRLIRLFILYQKTWLFIIIKDSEHTYLNSHLSYRLILTCYN